MKITIAAAFALIILSFAAFAQSGAGRNLPEKAAQSGKRNQRPADAQPAPTPSIAKADESVADDGEVLRVNTNLISVPVTVSDRAGRFVGDLKREDFQLFENGKPQRIEYFAATESPFTVALVLDNSLSAKFKIEEIQTAAYQFVLAMRPNDKVMIVAFDEQVHFLSEPTSDRETLRQAIRQTKFGGGTSLYTAMRATFNQMKRLPGRKAIVLFTDGVDTTSEAVKADDNQREAQELDALVYTIHYDTYADVQNQINNAPIGGGQTSTIPNSPVQLPGQQSPTIPGTSIPFPQLPQQRRNYPNRYPNPNDPNNSRYPSDPNDASNRFPTNPNDPNDPRNRGPVLAGRGESAEDYRFGKEYLEKLASNTGGRFYEADNRGGLGRAFDQISQELRRQYTIGYYPETTGNTGDRRAIQVKVNREKVSVRARDGYTVGKNQAKR